MLKLATHLTLKEQIMSWWMPKVLMSRLEVRFNEPSVSGMLNKSQRLLLGLFVLLLVDVIWVSSSELTKVSLWKYISRLRLNASTKNGLG